MGSVIDVTKCPRCGQETYQTDYYYRLGEEYCFCSSCGTRHNVHLRRDENRKVITRHNGHFDFGKIKLTARIRPDEKPLAETTINSREDFNVYNNHIGNPKAFQEHYPELCKKITDFALASPEKYKYAIEDYERGCFNDGSGDEYSVALWRIAIFDIVDENNKKFMYVEDRIEWDETGLTVLSPDYVVEHTDGYGVFTTTNENGITALYPFTEEPSEEKLNDLLNDNKVNSIVVLRDGKIVTIK